MNTHAFGIHREPVAAIAEDLEQLEQRVGNLPNELTDIVLQNATPGPLRISFEMQSNVLLAEFQRLAGKGDLSAAQRRAEQLIKASRMVGSTSRIYTRLGLAITQGWRLFTWLYD